jgi:enoyl-CoA hydratase/carnithine racemase
MNDVLCEPRERVLHLILNRPSKKNALTEEMYAALSEGLSQAATDNSLRCVLLYGTSEVFTAGNDLKDFLEFPPLDANAAAFKFMSALLHFPKPVVAAVAGPAIGIGTTLLPYCDLVYAAESARFQMPFVNLGLVPEAGSSFMMPLLLGPRRAAEYLLLGTPFGAQEALTMGLINCIVPATELIPNATAVAEQLAAKPPQALFKTKRLLQRSWLDAAGAALQREISQFLQALQGPEAKEAFTAFLEKRQPDFSKLEP